MSQRQDLPNQSNPSAAEDNGVAREEALKEKLSEYIYKTGRRPKTQDEKYKPISIRLHPLVIEWAKAEAKRRGVGYQSVINETLLEQIIS